MVIVLLLALVDIHTLFVLLFHNYLSNLYVFSGASFAILKGLIFYIPFRDKFSLCDIIVGTIMLFLLVTELFDIITTIIVLFLGYKIIASLASLKM